MRGSSASVSASAADPRPWCAQQYGEGSHEPLEATSRETRKGRAALIVSTYQDQSVLRSVARREAQPRDQSVHFSRRCETSPP